MQKFYSREDLSRAVDTVQEELSRCGNSVGYRTMWHNFMLDKGINALCILIMIAMTELDPDGALSRRKHRLRQRNYRPLGPNLIWHADEYDKLKPFGFRIHACIDGYSRKTLWLSVLKSNDNPATRASLYLDKFRELGFFPYCVQTVCGSENNALATSQFYFHRKSENHRFPHIFESSHHNQRIGVWWSQFRRSKSSFIIDMFKDLVQSGYYNCDDELQKAMASYCVNWTVAKSNGTGTIPENHFLMRYLVTLIIYIFFQVAMLVTIVLQLYKNTWT